VDFYPGEMTALFRKTILTSQLLGYVTFLPYTNDGSWNKQGAAATVEKEALLSAQIRLRSHQIPPLNLESQLSIAIARRRLTFTLPWVLEFLLAADSTSLQLPAYKRVTKLLVSIYRSYLKLYNKKKSISVDNLNFLRFWCGRFFSSEKVVKDILFQVEIPKLAGASERISFQEEEPLDHCDKIGKTLIELYFASKFTEMKSILHAGLEQQQQEPNEVAFLCTSINQSEPKHIRPIPAGPKKNSKQLKQIQLQIQLESSFFDSNPPSVKKTVEFIAERIASNYVKKLRAQMPQMRCDLASQDIFEVQASMDCKKRMFEGLEEFSKTRCNDTVNILIGEMSVTPSALNICQEITFRKCTEKVSEWIDNHIKAGKTYHTNIRIILQFFDRTIR
jgi:codanin-1